jgi:hypothetical protein
MAGPHPPNPTVGADGTPYAEASTGQTGQPGQPQALEYPHEPNPTEAAFGPGPAAMPPGDAARPSGTYAGAAPPPGSYPTRPTRRPKRVIIGLLAAIALVGALTAAIVYGVRTNGANTGGTFSEAAVRTAVQGYLDALEHRDVEVIAQNAMCGLYDAVRDKRSDQALARLNSDAFRKQFSQVEVTSIDKIVYWSQYQAQVLFTMRTAPAAGGATRAELQGVAQLLYQRNQIQVCSYVLRNPSVR